MVNDGPDAGRPIPRGPFTEDERARVRHMLLQHENANYFWRTVRIWLVWLGSAALAFAALKTTIFDFIRGLGK